MPDVRALLRETTARPGAHPDPVGAVHRTVRGRARRQAAVVAAVTAFAVVATGLVANGMVSRKDATPVVTEGDLHFDTTWRAFPPGVFAEDRAYDALSTLAGRHRDVFVGVRQVTGTTPSYEVALSADADPDAWADELAAAAQGRALSVEQCATTAAYLDRVATDVLSAPFPSGARVHLSVGTTWGVRYRFPCTVGVILDQEPTAADRIYASTRWGTSVDLRSPSEAGRI